MWPTVGTPRMCSDQSFSERPPPSWPPEQCFLATSGSRSDTDWWFKFVSKPSILSFSQPTESALAFGASKPWHTSGLGMESGFAVVTYFLLSPLNSNGGDLIRPLCSVELPAIGAIAGRSVPVLRIRTLASQWIPLGFSLGIGTTGHRDRPRRRADHAYNHSSESSRDAAPATMQSAVVWSDA